MRFTIDEKITSLYEIQGVEKTESFLEELAVKYDNDIFDMIRSKHYEVEFIGPVDFIGTYDDTFDMLPSSVNIDLEEKMLKAKAIDTVCKDAKSARAVFDIVFDEIDPEDYIERIDIRKHISFSDALDVVEAQDNWWEHTNTEVIDIQSVAGLVTFDNAHLLSHMLATHNPDVAKALFEELKYWSDAGRF